LRGSGARLLGRSWRGRSKRRRIGYIGGNSLAGRANDEAFLKGLAEAGYEEGRNVAIEHRWVEARNERLPGFVSDMINRRVTVIATVDSTAAALAAKVATHSIPIVFRIGGDPVAAGIVPNLGGVAELLEIESGVVSGMFNPNDSALARRWRPRHHGNP
jgi:hypothetical protein